MNENIELDECENIKKDIKECKHFHQDPYWTPNNYDLYFDYNKIPRNIPLENNHNLIKRLKKYLPLSKILHINMESENVEHDETVNICTGVKISFERVDNNGNIEKVVVDLK